VINPLRSEQEAFRFTLIVAVLVAPIVLAAVIWDSSVALGVAGGLAIGLLFAFLIRREDRKPERVHLRRRDTGDGSVRRILVVANETLAGAALRNEIERHCEGKQAEIRVVTPALNTRLKTWASDEDGAREAATERLQRILSTLEHSGYDAEGEIGDGDPVQAMEDELRKFPADEVIISTHPLGRSNWLERGVIERARERFEIPVTHVVVDLEREAGGAVT
jgi:GABA permease